MSPTSTTSALARPTARPAAVRQQPVRATVRVHPQATVIEAELLGEHTTVGAHTRIGAGTSTGERVGVVGSAVIGPGCTLHDRVVVEQSVFIGPGAHLGADVRIARSAYVAEKAVIGHGASIGAGALIGAGTIIAPTARIPAGADIPDGAIVSQGGRITEHPAPALLATARGEALLDAGDTAAEPDPLPGLTPHRDTHLAVWAQQHEPELYEAVVRTRRDIARMQYDQIPDQAAWDAAHDALDELIGTIESRRAGSY